MSVCYVEFSKPIDNWAEVSSFSYGMGASNVLAGTNRKASVHDVSFLMETDTMSQKVQQACVLGTVFSTVWVEFYKNADSDDPFLVYTLGNVVVPSASYHGGRMSVGLNFTTMKSDYYR